MRLFVLLGWALVCLGKVDSDTPIPGKLGDAFVLKPSNISEKITSITWKYGYNLAVQWDGTSTKYYRYFEDRSHLSVDTGALTINNLILSDSNDYTPEINNILQKTISLKVYSSVPHPTIVSKLCNKQSCTLICEGTTMNAEPVNYSWSRGKELLQVSSDTIHLKAYNNLDQKFTCTMTNPVSTMTSTSFTPFPAHHLYFVLLIIPLLLIVLTAFHRFKTGMYFYQKDSMCWTSDFWMSSNQSGNDANETKRMTEDGKN